MKTDAPNATYFLKILSVSDHEMLIRRLSNVEDGWCHGEGIKPSSSTIDAAIKLANYAHNNYLGVDAALGMDDEIQVAVFNNEDKSINDYLEFTIKSGILTNWARYQNKGAGWTITQDVDEPEKNSVKREIESYSKERPKCPYTSESFQRGSFSEKSKGSAVVSLRTTVAEYQLFSPPASRKPVKPSAHT